MSSANSTPSCRKACPTDWTLCILCQEQGDEKLVSPLINTYHSLADNLLRFHELGSVPLNINITRLDEGHGIEEALRSNKAVWHKSCFNKFNNLKLQRAQKRKSQEAVDETSPVKTRSVVSKPTEQNKQCTSCFFCNESAGELHRSSTFDIDKNVRWCATQLQDTELLAKLTMGDMHALDAYYHKKCLVTLYNKVRSMSTHCREDRTQSKMEAIALAQLVSYIEEEKTADNTSPAVVFKLSHLVKLYTTRLQELGASVPKRVNSTRLKDRLLDNVPDLRAYSEGREVMLAFAEDIGAALRFARDNNYDAEALHLVRAAKFIRKEILLKQKAFNGSFEADCHHQAVPDSLLAFVNMMLEGQNIESHSSQQGIGTNAALVISELLIFNAVSRARSVTTKVRHNIERETPLPIYLALVIHAETRKRKLVDKLYRLGLSISYDRVLQISADMGNSVCALYEKEGLVCPPKLKKELFTTGCVDNIDHNPSARTAKDSFHGTAISVTQHPSENSFGTDRDLTVIDPDIPKQKCIAKLPQSYTEIHPVVIRTGDQYAPTVHGPAKPPSSMVAEGIASEYGWLQKVEIQLKNDQLDGKDYISWSAYYASMQTSYPRPSAITALLPLFHEVVHTPAMILHSMKLVKEVVEYINPGQTPVLSMDQPLFAIGKQLQWNKAELCGEDRYILVLGGLHIEMVALRMLGHWLDNSGWVTALVQADVTTSGKADALLKASHVTRSRYAHQVSACTLHALQKTAYQLYVDSNSEPMDFTTWTSDQAEKHPQFQFWSVALKLELMVLEFVRSLREGNFPLYVQILGQLTPWMFALDHSHYARWLPVHIRDMLTLKEKHPETFAEFQAGKFVVQKSQHAFSLIALDQNHEQENAIIKDEGGAVGLTESPAALQRWMIAGPEVSRTVREFEATFTNSATSDMRHHDQIPHVQKTFAKDVQSLVSVMEEMGNPFMEDSTDLLVLDTKEIMPECVVKSVKDAQQIGQLQYDTFTSERLEDCSCAITDTIHKNKLPLFGNTQAPRSKVKTQMASLKSDCNLFARLYIGCQARDGNLEEFFKHENQACPPALSSMGKIRIGTKSELLSCIEIDPSSDAPEVDMKVLDGAAIVNMLPPAKCKTFQDYATLVFVPYIEKQAQTVKRLDLVWDRYFPNSLKQTTRETRGQGVRRRVLPNVVIPTNWKSFLRSDENKAELFVFLAKCVVNLNGVQVISTFNDDVVSSQPIDKCGIALCNHEEADTRVLLHVAHGVKHGHRKVMIRTVDTDVLVLGIAFTERLGLQELWVAFGVGKHFRYIPAHKSAGALGSSKCDALPFFHAVTGCDTVSSFSGRGKQTAFGTWKTFPEVTPAFQRLSAVSNSIPDESFQLVERFIILMYSRTCPLMKVNNARQALFAQGTRTIENIPPSEAALLEHVRRATYQAGHIWGQALVALQELASPADWGWESSTEGWKPVWSALPEASKSCHELIHCGCKKSCRGLCKCHRASLPCTALCFCGGNCHRV